MTPVYRLNWLCTPARRDCIPLYIYGISAVRHMKQNKHEYIYNISATLKEQQTDGRTDRSHGMQPSHLIPYHFWFLLRQWIFNLNLTNLASEWVSEWMTVCVSMDGVKWLGKWHEIAMPIAVPSFYFIQQTFIIIRRRMDGYTIL